MFLSVALRSQLNREDVESSPEAPPTSSSRRNYCALSFWEILGSKLHLLCMLSFMVIFAVLCVGVFEAERLSNHIVSSPCTVIGREILEIGTCSVCSTEHSEFCDVYPIATARLHATFVPITGDANITSSIWYCKGRASFDRCDKQIHDFDQYTLDRHDFQGELDQMRTPAPVPCTSGELNALLDEHSITDRELPSAQTCFYNSRDLGNEEVWLSMPSTVMAHESWLHRHLEFPLFWALGCLIFVSVLFGCLALEGVDVM